jgi:hypothetical protein
MAIVTLPTFSDNEIVTPEKLNALVAALNAKFVGGFDSSDLQWPLEAEDDLAMGIYNITGARQISGVINAANYDDLQAAVTAAGSGGCVFIPPDTTITHNAVTFSGNGVAIVGAGPSSEIKLTADTTGSFLLRSGTTGQTGFLIANLTLDGNSSTGTNNKGLQLQHVHDVVIHAVTFKNFSGPALELTDGGTATSPCERVSITQCIFSGGSGNHILVNDVVDLYAFGNTFVDNEITAICLEADTSGKQLKRIKIVGNSILSGANPAISIAGSAATTSENWSDISVANNSVHNMTGADPVFQIGTTTGGLLRVSVCDNRAVSAVDTGLSICADYGTVRGNLLYTAGADGIDLTESVMLDVSDNDVRTATVNGIDAHDSVSCTVHDNRTQGSAVPILHSATLRQWANGDTVGVVPYTAYFNPTPGASVLNTNSACTATIAANSLHVVDVLKIRGMVNASGDANAGTCSLFYHATSGSPIAIAAGAILPPHNSCIEASMVIISATTAMSVYTVVNNTTHHVGFVDTITVNLATAATVYLTAEPGSNTTVCARSILVERSMAELQ